MHGVGRLLDVQGGEAWARELAQQHAEDVVIAASLFKPNAPGSSELSWSGLKPRQMMKARGIYLGERTISSCRPSPREAGQPVRDGRRFSSRIETDGSSQRSKH